MIVIASLFHCLRSTACFTCVKHLFLTLTLLVMTAFHCGAPAWYLNHTVELSCCVVKYFFFFSVNEQRRQKEGPLLQKGQMEVIASLWKCCGPKMPTI